ncbi:MAG: Mrp/NBP35 family ATP-binding protein [Myxococcota bacterium]
MFGKKGKGGLDEAQIRAALGGLKDPVDDTPLDQRLESVKSEHALQLQLVFPSTAWEGRAASEVAIRKALEEAGETRDIRLDVRGDVKPARPQGTAQSLVPGAKNVLLFASGKGGVGKSTVATNVAAALARTGAQVGLLDADIYGPSVPTMFGVTERPEVVGQKLKPVQKHGLALMSIGLIVEPSQAMSWRGPMLNGALTQFMRDVDWGELDYLVLDMPPGTGDVQLTIAQNLKVAGAVLVSTPQDVALADVIRGKAMFDKVDVPVLGVVENMAWFVCGDCGAKHYIFSKGGANRLASEIGVPLLGEIPLEQSTREAGDAGVPEVIAHPESGVAQAFDKLAHRVATELAVSAAKQSVKPGRGLKIIQ